MHLKVFLKSFFICTFSHAGHSHFEGAWKNGISWIGNFHPVFLHFPIALILMTVVAEILNQKKPSLLFQHAARFMLVSAAIFAIPTALSGLAFSYNASYQGLLAVFFWWHRFLGIGTACLSISAALLKELARKKKVSVLFYGITLVMLVLFLVVGSYLGGKMTFGM